MDLSAEHGHDARTIFIDEPCLDRDKPGLREHKKCKGQLDCSPAPVVLRVDRIDEQRPAVLKIRDHSHADDAHRELQPTEIRTVSNRSAGIVAQ